MIQRNYPFLRNLPTKLIVKFLKSIGVDKYVDVESLNYLPQQILFPIANNKITDGRLHVKIEFLEGANYKVEGEDQHDWLKLTGIKESTLKPYWNTTMLAFRNNLDKRQIELCFYTHIGGVKLYESFDLFVDYNAKIDVTVIHTGTKRKVIVWHKNDVYEKELDCNQKEVVRLKEVSGTLGGTAKDIPMIKIKKTYLF